MKMKQWKTSLISLHSPYLYRFQNARWCDSIKINLYFIWSQGYIWCEIKFVSNTRTLYIPLSQIRFRIEYSYTVEKSVSFLDSQSRMMQVITSESVYCIWTREYIWWDIKSVSNAVEYRIYLRHRTILAWVWAFWIGQSELSHKLFMHYGDVIMGAMASQISPASRLFIQPFFQVQTKKNT